MSEVTAAPEAPAAAPTAPAAPAPSAPAAVEQAAGGNDPAQNTAESAPAAKPEGEKPESQEAKAGKSRYERRLDRAYRKAAEEKARADFYAKQVEELRPKAAPEDPGAPRLENFDDIEKYAAAKAKHESDRVLKEHTAKQHAETQKQAQTRLVEGWEAKADRASSKYDDFEEVVGDIKPTTPWAMAIMEADNGEDIAYHLGKNLKEAQRIAALPPLAQIREIGKLEAKLAAEPIKPKAPSKAPAPITPLSGNAPADNATPSEKDDIGDWMKKRSKQVHGARR
jgi:hypothetical protein